MSAVKAQTKTQNDADHVAASASKRKMLLYACLAGLALALLINSVRSPPVGTKEPQRGMADIFFNKNAQEVAGPRPVVPTYTQEELLAVAKAAKNAGLIVQGVTQCGYTRKQRELFGGIESEARKVFESMYIECRTRDMCPNVRGYPTWSRGELQFPGYRSIERIKELIKEVSPLPAQQAPRDSSLPNEENIPDAQAAVPAAPIPQEIKAQDNVNVAETRLVKPMQAALDQQIEQVDETEGEDGDGQKIERVRGVSRYAPLNVPDMPGTAPMTTGGLGQADYQFAQGNLPRQALQNPEPVIALARQMAFTFSQIAHDAARNPNASAYAEARLPQSSNITTGNPLDDNRIYTEKN